MKNLVWLLVLCSILAISCNKSADVINETNYDISIVDLNDLSDSTYNNIEFYINNPIYKGSIGILSKGGSIQIRNYIRQGPKKRMYLFVFKTDTLIKYHGIKSMKDLMREHKYFQSIKLSEEQLKNADWKIRIN